MVRPARLARIEVAKQAMNFSAAHFTIFSATEREDLHGHNFQLACSVTAPVDDTGLMFDYAIIKRRLRALCDEIDEKMLLPAHSPFLEITDEAGYTIAHFNDSLKGCIEVIISFHKINNRFIRTIFLPLL